MTPKENVLQMEPAVRAMHRQARRLGSILIEHGKLTPETAEQVGQTQRELGLRYGDAALQLKLISGEDLRRALADQYDFHVLEPALDGVSREVIAAYAPDHPRVEELRLLRTQLLIRWYSPETGRCALAIVSPGPAEGRSFVAANLAVGFAQLGHRTLLLDADMRTPRQHRLFNVSDRMGLSAVLTGRADASAAIPVPGCNDLWVLPAGSLPPNPQELLSRPAFALLLKDLQREYDVVLIDTPPAKLYADVQSIAFRAGAALAIARRDQTKIADAAEVVRELNDAGIRVVGTVMNAF
ncbi:MAG TPA: chain length determinant protein tyrosine kinase EpsG [Burkholderiales bacterium]|jgi:chain length determinant protein tyrosine kinase EpsG|nr:chain length determinant protein tyrosine kinase EpsG [Burkholderiales bacterium]